MDKAPPAHLDLTPEFVECYRQLEQEVQRLRNANTPLADESTCEQLKKELNAKCAECAQIMDQLDTLKAAFDRVQEKLTGVQNEYKRSLSERDEALTTIATLEERLAGLAEQPAIEYVAPVLNGASTGKLIDQLLSERDEIAKRWRMLYEEKCRECDNMKDDLGI